jgi:uncharacterized glyoxalase superfamily protein PhnB
MKIEHVAFQHPDPIGAAEWYSQHLGMKVVRASDGPAKARFLADETGSTVLEIYNNPAANLPDYPKMNPLVLHIAFLAVDIEADAKRLVAAGATLVEAPAATPSGDKLGMLRDPWGVPLQLAQRAKPLVG